MVEWNKVKDKLSNVFDNAYKQRGDNMYSQKITINGRTFCDDLTSDEDLNITAHNGQLIIHGNVVECDDKIVHVEVFGSVNNLTTSSGDITVHQNVDGGIDTKSGSVTINGEVKGSVKTVSGSVIAQSIQGNTSTMSGNIISR